MSREAKILLAIVVVIVGGMIALFALTNKPDAPLKATADAGKLIRDNTHSQGTGSVQVVEFGDYQCPACGAAYPIIKQIQKDYDGKITLYFRNYPLSQHQNAQAAAEAAEAANDQGKFWEMHDKLYETQSSWENSGAPNSTFEGYAKDLGLDVGKFTTYIENKSAAQIIKTDQDDGDANGISATPTIYIAGKKIDNYSYDTIKAAIDAALKG